MNVEKAVVHYLSTGSNPISREKEVLMLQYNNYNLYILNEDRNEYGAYVLYKDVKGEYWLFKGYTISPKRYIPLINGSIDEFDREDYTRYCDYMNEKIKAVYDDFPTFLKSKIENESYFSKMELSYIQLYIPELYQEAEKSKELFETRKSEKEAEDKRIEEQRKNQEIKEKNKVFFDKIYSTKVAIHEGKEVISEMIEYYRDNNYDDKVQQNIFLYLFKEYGINVALATQGFINNKLYSYNFGTGGSRSYGKYKGEALYVSLDKLKEEVDKELFKNKNFNEMELEM